MLSLFSDFASWLIYSIAEFDSESKLGQSLHFFIEDTTKIFFLLVIMIYFIALIRASLNIEKVRDFYPKSIK
jgi:hypothetical protein